MGYLCLKEACKMKVKCWECETVIEVDIESEWFDSKGYYNPERFNPPKKAWRRFYCESCNEIVKKRIEEEKNQYVELKIKMMQERALDILEKQKIDFYEYSEAIKAVQEFSLEQTDKFDSSYEMIAAIILIHNRIQVKLQYKISKYKVDFFLPDYKCALEIDGERHQHNTLYDSNRDIKIRQILGSEWEIVRIDTKYLEQNAKVLPKAIVELKKLKQDTRRKNNGIIPSHFSKRDKAKSEEVERIAKT